MTVCPEGCHSNSEDTRSIRIGTVPLAGYQDNVPNPLQDQMPKQVMPIINQPIPTVRPFTNSYPNQNSPYPGQNSPYPGHNPPYPIQNSSYPGQNPSYPNENSSYPGQNSPYPGQNAPYPSPNPPYPGAIPNPVSYPGTVPQSNPPYPGAMIQPYPISPGQNAPYPVVSAPTQTTPNPGNPYPQTSPRVSPYPDRANSSLLKTGTIGFTVPSSNVPVPSLPPGTNVPYPLTVSIKFN